MYKTTVVNQSLNEQYIKYVTQTRGRRAARVVAVQRGGFGSQVEAASRRSRDGHVRLAVPRGRASGCWCSG